MRLVLQSCVLLIMAATHLPVHAAAETWKAGVARVKITPEQGIWLGGYAARDRPAEGTLHDLWVKSLALEDARGNRSVLIAADLLNVTPDMRNTVCRVLEKRFGLAPADVMLTCSHTHTGPVLTGRLETMYALSQEQKAKIGTYTRQLEHKIVQVTVDALEDLQPAKLMAGQGTAEFAVNRRNNREADVPRLREEGKALKGPVDHDVPVLAVRAPDGELRAVVFGYACHCTVLNFYRWSGDYAGFAQLRLEKDHPGVTAMFWQGCGADQNPLPRRSVELAEKYGRMLAAGVEEVLETSMQALRPTLKTAFHTTKLAFDEVATPESLEKISQEKGRRGRWARLCLERLEAKGDLPKQCPYPVQAWRLGEDQLWVALGGEVVVDYALMLKRRYGPRTWVAGYANDIMAYIPSRRVWEEGGYESGCLVLYGLPAEKWKGDIEEHVLAAVDDVVKKVQDKSTLPSGVRASKGHLVFLVSEDPNNYEAHKTVPQFAGMLQEQYGFKSKVIHGEGDPGAFHFPGLEEVRQADLLVIFFRRRALSSDQMELIRSHLKAGKPLIGIRTANHAFSVHGDVADGHEKWWEFVPEVLGCKNRGYGPQDPGTEVEVVTDADSHPILKDIKLRKWHSDGNLYLVKPLVDLQAKVLLTGSFQDTVEPIAWTRMYGSSRVFYTSLGYPTDFERPQFRRLLVNAIHWALGQSVP
jgi:type 1 glutamine amidotransferase